MSTEEGAAPHRRAEEYLLAGRLAEARALLDAPGPSAHPGTALARARVAVLENRLEEAARQLQHLLARAPSLATARGLLAEVHYRRGEFAAAARLQRALGHEEFATHLERFGSGRPYAFASGGSATLPWVCREPLPVVHARIGDQTLNLVLDTGAGDLMLDASAAEAAGVAVGAEAIGDFAGGHRAAVRYGAVDRLALGALTVSTVPVQVMALTVLFAPWFPDCTIHGVLGTGLFSRLPTILDYRNGRLELGEAAAAGGLSLPLYLAGSHYPLVPAQLEAGTPLLLFVDTGMSGVALALAPSAARQAGLAPDGGVVAGQGGAGTVGGRSAGVSSLRLGGRSFAPGSALVLEDFPLEHRFGVRVAGLLGHDFFRGRCLALDFTGGRLSLT